MAPTSTFTLLAPMAIFTVILNLVLYLAVPVLLQIFLSTRKNKWFGLVLPILGAVIALFLLLILVLNTTTATAVHMSVLLGVLAFVPPALLLFIYYICRRQLKRKKMRDEMVQMNIQDL